VNQSSRVRVSWSVASAEQRGRAERQRVVALQFSRIMELSVRYLVRGLLARLSSNAVRSCSRAQRWRGCGHTAGLPVPAKGSHAGCALQHGPCCHSSSASRGGRSRPLRYVECGHPRHKCRSRTSPRSPAVPWRSRRQQAAMGGDRGDSRLRADRGDSRLRGVKIPGFPHWPAITTTIDDVPLPHLPGVKGARRSGDSQLVFTLGDRMYVWANPSALLAWNGARHQQFARSGARGFKQALREAAEIWAHPGLRPEDTLPSRERGQAGRRRPATGDGRRGRG